MRTLSALALLLAVAGCSSAADAPSFTTPAPETDAGGDVIAPSTPEASTAAPEASVGGAEAATSDALREAMAPPTDAGSDAAPDGSSFDANLDGRDAPGSGWTCRTTSDLCICGRHADPPAFDASPVSACPALPCCLLQSADTLGDVWCTCSQRSDSECQTTIPGFTRVLDCPPR
ncbi:MAG TPA: hypothetical protein VK550_11200 [Polyangiaceae bacterium]|nr:hypothetical protein [Polyangiaceae bacterium]